MSTQYTPRPIEPKALAQLRERDDAGRPCVPYVDEEGGSPLRCCLRPIPAGDRVALVAYAPLRRWAARTGAQPGAYDEQGPVFIHADPCAGPVEADLYPFARAGALRTLRRYDARGRIVGGRLLEIPEDTTAGFDAAFEEAFADPEVTQVHVRAVEHGCLQFVVHRPEGA
ncbi:DUF1203 domain-containing protein [Streptomyces spectabilis]|uniref:DUF1203 domain-containing protein n=1 Tax=Streptomyces spectabilis TaxID=68270 RepID=A0A5P2XC52_STRST|nr:DUF1203 domain-containing protein [Streptomyces spectabilis]MBB5109113.1 hypothetical protein [Streptomyces spectabilis]MCI3902755.1 DUF1203 domain-containing protein [Streptomyces spectabilis]QEV60052.1 DUF1203 domain-containing protein [Streptomyces spectabilis]